MESTAEIRLPLAAGLGAGAWLALHAGDRLLDRRVLDPAWHDQDVEVELDARTRVEVLISRGEGPSIEFKQQLPGAKPQVAMKTVDAFANGERGALLFRVDDDGTVVGLGDLDDRAALDRLTSLITAWVRPLVQFMPTIVDVRGARVLVVDVAPGNERPYGVGTTDRRFDYYVRRAGTTFPAGPGDIRALAQRALSPPVP